MYPRWMEVTGYVSLADFGIVTFVFVTFVFVMAIFVEGPYLAIGDIAGCLLIGLIWRCQASRRT
jgi:hypothetical protein